MACPSACKLSRCRYPAQDDKLNCISIKASLWKRRKYACQGGALKAIDYHPAAISFHTDIAVDVTVAVVGESGIT